MKIKMTSSKFVVMAAVNLASASIDQIQRTLRNIDVQSIAQRVEFVQLKSSLNFKDETDLKIVEAQLDHVLGQLDELKNQENEGYGCWCSFHLWDTLGSGYGKPQDQIDELCRNWLQGYRCSFIDSVRRYVQADKNLSLNATAREHFYENIGDQNVGCREPWEIEYPELHYLTMVSIVMGDESESQIIDKCTSNNDFECAREACILDNVFLKEFSALIVNSGYSVNSQYYNNPNFDRATCRNGDGKDFATEAPFPWERTLAQDDWKQCCGDYPRRFPFAVKDGSRFCCNARTYDSSKFQCCDGNQPSSQGFPKNRHLECRKLFKDPLDHQSCMLDENICDPAALKYKFEPFQNQEGSGEDLYMYS